MNRYRASSTLRTRPRLVIGSLLTLASLLIGACAAKPTATGLPSDAQAIINSPEYAHGSWNWDVVELGSGRTLYASNENKLNFLGSTTKLFTVGTYYEEFGADAAGFQGDFFLAFEGDNAAFHEVETVLGDAVALDV